MAQPFHLDASTAGGWQVLAASGEIDLSVSRIFERALLAALAATPRGGVMAVDMTMVEFFDSSATRALAHAARAAEATNATLHVSASPVVWRILDITGIYALPAFHVVPEHAADTAHAADAAE